MIHMEKKQVWYRVGVIAAIVMVFGVLLGAVVWRAAAKAEAYQSEQAAILADVEVALAELYSDVESEAPNTKITQTQIEAVEEKLSGVVMRRYAETKDEISRKLANLRKFVSLSDKWNGYFVEGVLKVEATVEDVQAAQKEVDELPESYTKVLRGKLAQMQAQLEAIANLKTAVQGLFTDEKMTVVKPKLTRAQYKAVVEQAEKLPQRELAESYDETLAQVDKVLVQREKEAAEARQRALEAKRRAEELRRQQQKEEAAAWKVLNVPYHSQNWQQIYNGCEAASMLMALQYKGYLRDVDLHKYAEMMPKSEDYNTGFVGSIYDLQPKTYVHWIAPAPLAKFGRESSGNANVVDISGASLADLDKEVVAGNPVIIYVTFLFNPLKEWLNGAPKNLHVVLLTGYNEKTGAQRLTDPWTQADGGRTFDVPRAELEKIYNAVGKRAVVVR